MQRVNVDVFDRHTEYVRPILPAAPCCGTRPNPVGRFIAGPRETLAIDKRFDQHDGMAVLGAPISRQPP